MDVWKTPVELFVVVSVAFFATLAARSVLWWWNERLDRPLALLFLLLIVAATPFMVQVAIRQVSATHPREAKYIHEVPLYLVMPAAISLAVIGLEQVSFGRFGTSWRFSLERFLFYVIAACFISLNFINWCSPGWCYTFGFPLPWYHWSDALNSFNGEIDSPVSVALATANIVIFCTAALAYGRALRNRERTRFVFTEFES